MSQALDTGPLPGPNDDDNDNDDDDAGADDDDHDKQTIIKTNTRAARGWLLFNATLCGSVALSVVLPQPQQFLFHRQLTHTHSSVVDCAQ